MKGIRIRITRFLSNDQPGFVECTFKDAWGKEFKIEEKVPVVTSDFLDADSKYPCEGVIACEVIKKWTDETGRQLVTIDIDKPWAIETVDGLKQFDIMQKDLIEI